MKTRRVLRVRAPETVFPAEGSMLFRLEGGDLIAGGSRPGMVTDEGAKETIPTKDVPLAAGGRSVVTKSALWTRRPGEWYVCATWPEPAVGAAVGPNAVLLAFRDRLASCRPDGSVAWSYPLDVRDATLRMAVAEDGSAAFAKLGDRSELVVLNPEGSEVERRVLPGLARSAVAVGNDFVLRVLTGSGYKLVRVARGREPVTLAGSSKVMVMATDGRDLVGVGADGRVAEWRADGPRVEYQVGPLGGRVVSLTATATHVAVLTAGDAPAVARVRRPKR
jgi:hypothetical protein